MSGKGDKRRRGSDDEKYREGWERIFGKQQPKQNSKKEGNNEKEAN